MQDSAEQPHRGDIAMEYQKPHLLIVGSARQLVLGESTVEGESGGEFCAAAPKEQVLPRYIYEGNW